MMLKVIYNKNLSSSSSFDSNINYKKNKQAENCIKGPSIYLRIFKFRR